jgi:NDP-sugar pyrophosphorylase family protein
MRGKAGMVDTTLVVMAAGIGSRYGGLKQMDPVGPGGEKIVDYSVFDARRAGFEKVVFVIRRDLEEEFRERIGRAIERHVDANYVFQELEPLPAGFRVPKGRVKPWGTAHAVAACRDVVRTPFAVINADDFYGPSAFRLLGDHLRKAEKRKGAHDYCLVGYRLENTLSEHGHVSRGVCAATPDGYLREINERTRVRRRGQRVQYTDDGDTWIDLAADSVVSMNMWGFTPSLFEELEKGFVEFLRERGSDPKAEYFLPARIGDLVASRRARVKVLPTDEKWFGITYPEDRVLVEQAVTERVEAGLYPPSLWGEPGDVR